jgi:hypothetical protein
MIRRQGKEASMPFSEPLGGFYASLMAFSLPLKGKYSMESMEIMERRF